jgi:subtilisin family serine protease
MRTRLSVLIIGLLLFCAPAFALQESIPLINANDVWAKYPTITGAGQTVAVIDTGIDYNHSALGGGFGVGHRVVAGWDFVDNDADPMDLNGHGTHVAGIIGSSNSTYKGVAPQVNFAALRILDANGEGNFVNLALALSWVIQNRTTYNITTVNLSLGDNSNWLDTPSNPVFETIEVYMQELVNDGVFIAVAAGNGFYSFGSVPGLGFPAVSDYVVSVGAVWDKAGYNATWADGARDYTTAPDAILSISQRSEDLDLLAPGAVIRSTIPGNTYGNKNGTSMAAPFVAGASVLLREAFLEGPHHLETDQWDLLSVLQDTGKPVVDTGFNTNVTGTGLTFYRIDVLAATDVAMTPEPSAYVLCILALSAFLFIRFRMR